MSIAARPRLVSGVTLAEGKSPSALFAAHASAIAEVCLAVREHGPPVGITGTGWWPDRAGWHTWQQLGADVTLSPDAILTATITGPDGQVRPAVALIEVDLATMTQTKLREKVSRYLAYAQDRQWQGRWPHSPPLLVMTTTPARALTFVRAATKVAAAARRAAAWTTASAGTAAPATTSARPNV